MSDTARLAEKDRQLGERDRQVTRLTERVLPPTTDRLQAENQPLAGRALPTTQATTWWRRVFRR